MGWSLRRLRGVLGVFLLVVFLLAGVLGVAVWVSPAAREQVPAVAKDVVKRVARVVVEPVRDPDVACDRFYAAVWGGSSRRWSNERVVAELVGLQAATAGEGDSAMHQDLNAIEAASSDARRQELVVATLDRCQVAGHITGEQVARVRAAARERLRSTEE